MNPEIVDTAVAVLDRPACGNINPSSRVAKGEISDERIDQLAREIGLYYVWLGDRLVTIDGKDKSIDKTMQIPKWCVDGRPEYGDTALAPNAAGGTYSLVVGDALIDTDSVISNQMTSATHGRLLFNQLTSLGYDIGGHEDTNASGENCGCGACDKMATILNFMAENIDTLSEKAAALGVTVKDELQEKIITNVHKLQESGYVSSGSAMNQAIKDVTGEDNSQKLVGPHNEVVLVVNTVAGTTVDRHSVSTDYGDKYQVFNFDVWALKNGINAIAVSPNESEQKFAVAVLYNLATTCVLAGSSLRVVVRN